MTREITVAEFEQNFPRQYEAWVKGLIANSQDEFFVTKDGRPGFTAVDAGGGYQSDPSFVWNEELGDFDEDYPEDDDEP